MANAATRIFGAIQRLVSGIYLATDPTLSNGQTHPLRVNSKANLLVDTSGGGPPAPTSLPATYRVAFDGIVFTPAGGTILQLRNPVESGKVVRVTLMRNVKPSATMTWTVVKLSTITTGGTNTQPTVVPMDSTNLAPVGVLDLYTDNAAIVNGAVVGKVWDDSLTAGDIVEDDPGSNPVGTQPIVLRAGEAAIWKSNVAVTFQGTVEWFEAAT